MKAPYAVFIIICLAFVTNQSWAQKEGNYWYFGDHAGLNFHSQYPQPVFDGKMDTREGCASISDKKGNLLFYTDGITVWNKEHMEMPNGFGLYGDPSATQSAIIIPYPGSDYLYYIFTVSIIAEGKGLNYSIVDMSFNNGTGDVIQKNRPLLEKSTEKITAVLHKNKTDYWVIAHEWQSNVFYAYPVTSSGIGSPRTSAPQGAFVHQNEENDNDNNFGAIGYLKASPNGSKLAHAIQALGAFEIFSFNNATGKIDLMASMDGYKGAYSVEFATTGDFLYGGTRSAPYNIYQWDLRNDPSASAIKNSSYLVANLSSGCGALQLGLNGMIYIARNNKNYLGVIKLPTRPGEECHYEEKGVSLLNSETGEQGVSKFGLPTFLTDFFKPAEFYFENTCLGDLTKFYITTTIGLTEISWDFGDPQSHGNRIDNEYYPDHIFSKSGSFVVTLTTVRNGNRENFRDTIEIYQPPEVDFGDEDRILCSGDTLALDAGNGAFYKWNNGNELRVNRVTRPGEYFVEVKDIYGCYGWDTVNVIERPKPEIDSVKTTEAFCNGSNGTAIVFPHGEDADFEYEWLTTPPQYTQKAINLNYGVKVVHVTNNFGCTTIVDTIAINELGAPEILIEGPQDTICPGDTIMLVASGAEKYLWSTGETGDTIYINPYYSKSFSVEGSALHIEDGNTCSSVETIPIKVFPYKKPDLGKDTTSCEGLSISFFAGHAEEYLWSTGSTDSSYTLAESDTLSVRLTDIYQCHSYDTVVAIFNPNPVPDLGKDRSFCNNDPFTLDAGEGESYLWNTGHFERYLTVSKTGRYEVTVTREGCHGSNSVFLQFNDIDSLQVDSLKITDISCYGANDGEVQLFPSGMGTHYYYSIDNGQNFFDNQGHFENLFADSIYQVTIWEDSACMIISDEIQVTEPSPINLRTTNIPPSCSECEDGRIVLDIQGGSPPFEVLWSDFFTGSSRSQLPAGNYSLSIIDSRNCRFFHEINLDAETSIKIPDAFTPNGDGINDRWTIIALKDYPLAIVTVFDKAGKVIFQSEPGYPEAWDGTSNGQPLVRGAYYYIIKLNNTITNKVGVVNIIK